MSEFPRVPLHDLRNSNYENPKKSCSCEECKKIKQRKNKIFGCFFRKLFTKQYLLKEFN